VSNVIKLRPTTTEYWGGCPYCGTNDGYINLGAEHWFVCGAHQTKWCVGSNLFSGWQDDTEEQRAESAAKLSGFRAVEPIHMTREQQDGARS